MVINVDIFGRYLGTSSSSGCLSDRSQGPSLDLASVGPSLESERPTAPGTLVAEAPETGFGRASAAAPDDANSPRLRSMSPMRATPIAAIGTQCTPSPPVHVDTPVELPVDSILAVAPRAGPVVAQSIESNIESMVTGVLRG